LPPGTSKFNKIEHRLWAQVTSNWRDQPLTSCEVIVNLIGATTTRTGLSVHAELDEGTYPRGIKVTDSEMAAIRPRFDLTSSTVTGIARCARPGRDDNKVTTPLLFLGGCLRLARRSWGSWFAAGLESVRTPTVRHLSNWMK
jgi:hypothetical protein